MGILNKVRGELLIMYKNPRKLKLSSRLYGFYGRNLIKSPIPQMMMTHRKVVEQYYYDKTDRGTDQDIALDGRQAWMSSSLAAQQLRDVEAKHVAWSSFLNGVVLCSILMVLTWLFMPTVEQRLIASFEAQQNAETAKKISSVEQSDYSAEEKLARIEDMKATRDSELLAFKQKVEAQSAQEKIKGGE